MNKFGQRLYIDPNARMGRAKAPMPVAPASVVDRHFVLLTAATMLIVGVAMYLVS